MEWTDTPFTSRTLTFNKANMPSGLTPWPFFNANQLHPAHIQYTSSSRKLLVASSDAHCDGILQLVTSSIQQFLETDEGRQGVVIRILLPIPGHHDLKSAPGFDDSRGVHCSWFCPRGRAYIVVIAQLFLLPFLPT